VSDELCPKCNSAPGSGVLVDSRADLAVAVPCPRCSRRCPVCDDTGTVERVDARGYDYLVPCACQSHKRRIELFNRAQIPGRYAHCVLQGVNPREGYHANGGNQHTVKLALHKHVEGSHANAKGLLLSGKVGTGKTHLMVSVLRTLTLERAVPCRFIEFTHLLSDIKEGFSQGRSEADVLGPVTRIRVLGIDELGKGGTTDWQISILDEIISRRYNQRLTTYFTTNLPLAAPEHTASRAALEAATLEDRVGPRIFSRLHEMCDFLEVIGPDARRAGH
jgi:DNA replication protein DnaC